MSEEFNADFIGDMRRDEWLERSDRIHALAWSEAQQTVVEMGLETELILPRSISGLYSRANEQYQRSYDRLHDLFRDRLPALFAYAQWVKWVSCWDGAHWFRHSIEHGVLLDNDHTRSFCTAAGYARKEGWSCAVFNKLGELSQHSVLEGVPERFGLKDKPSDHLVLTAMELHWLWLASDSNPCRGQLLEFLHEAGEADALSNGLHSSRLPPLGLCSMTHLPPYPPARPWPMLMPTCSRPWSC